MANFFCIIGEQQSERSPQVGTENAAGSKSLGFLQSAKVLKVEAASEAAAVTYIQQTLPGSLTGKPVVVTEANYKVN